MPAAENSPFEANVAPVPLAVATRGLLPNLPPPRRADPAIARFAQLRIVVDRTVASAFAIDVMLMLQSSRGRAGVARARQVAMYLTHVMCGLSLTRVGELYERDRTTVAHACQIVEDLREDREFNQAIAHLECAIAIMLQASELADMAATTGRLM